jgi:hypothetical protein
MVKCIVYIRKMFICKVKYPLLTGNLRDKGVGNRYKMYFCKYQYHGRQRLQMGI